MKDYFKISLLVIGFLFSFMLLAEDDNNQNLGAGLPLKADNPENKNVKVKYKESSRIDFESLLIEGERKKPELSVVTGNIGEKDNGLLIMRADFKDMMANDFGEVVE